MDYCARCGLQLRPRQQFCTRCGAPHDPNAASSSETVHPDPGFPPTQADLRSRQVTSPPPPLAPPSGFPVPPVVPTPAQPRMPPPDRRVASTAWPAPRPARGPGWYVGVALGLVALLGVVAGAVLLRPHPSSKSTNVLPPVLTTPAQTTAPATSASPPRSPVSSAHSPTTAPPVYRGNSVVSVAPAAGSQATARAVVALLSRYFTDINTGKFADYRLLYSPAKSESSLGQIAHDYRSTIDTHARLIDLATAADGRPAATVTFTSHQHAVDGPDGQTCTHWQVTFFLEATSNGYLIGTPPADYSAQRTAC
jgi:hypothetical protein